MPLQVWSSSWDGTDGQNSFCDRRISRYRRSHGPRAPCRRYRVFTGARRLDRIAGLAAAGAALLSSI